MRQVRAIAARETAAFFHSAMAPAVLTVFLVEVGLFFTIYLFGYSDMSLMALQSARSGNYLNLAEGLFRPQVSNTVFFLHFLMPALAMRLFAPDLRSGRYELIASWPVADRVWVAGKWLSAMAVAALMILTGAAYLAVVWLLGSPEPGPALTAVLGQLLFAGCLLAWGLLASTLVSHQLVAFFLAFVWSLVLFLVGALERFVPGAAGRILDELSTLGHFERLSRGVLDSRDVLYFVLMTAVPLVLARSVLAARRLPAGRRTAQWVPALLTVVLSVLVYAVGLQAPATWDTTGNKRYSLAPQSLQILDGLGDELDGLAARARDGEAGVPRGDLDHVVIRAFYKRLDPALDTIEALLQSCAQRTDRLRYEIVDQDLDLEYVRRYGITDPRTIVVEVGDRFATLREPEESALLSAVYRLASGRMARVCYLVGHGQHQVDSDEKSGYATFGQLLMEQGYDLRPLQLGAQGRVPESCDVLVIAGPRLEPEASELAAIDEHLARGGAVLGLFDPPTPERWRAWLAGLRVDLTGDVVMDIERVGAQAGGGPRLIVVGDGYGDHEIVRSLQGKPTVFPMVQSLAEAGEPDSTVAGAILVKSSRMTWGETDPGTRFSGRPRYDDFVDQKGPLPLAMVLEVRRGADAAPPGRLVVVGNSEFLNNDTINQRGNRDLLLNAVGWLAREEALIQVRGFDPLSQPVVLTAEQKEVFGWGALVGWPLFVGSLALGFMLRHRRRGSVA
jgi:ABC-2 type transport system permease protein